MKRVNSTWLWLLFLLSCAPARQVATGFKQVTLNFEKCRVLGDYEKIRLTLPIGFDLITIEPEEGFCEYHLLYPDQSIIYVSSDIYSGSRLNFENRLSAGVNTYSVNRSISDTMSIRGQQEDGRYWFESIRGTYVIGYVNLKDTSRFEGVEALCQ